MAESEPSLYKLFNAALPPYSAYYLLSSFLVASLLQKLRFSSKDGKIKHFFLFGIEKLCFHYSDEHDVFSATSSPNIPTINSKSDITSSPPQSPDSRPE